MVNNFWFTLARVEDVQIYVWQYICFEIDTVGEKVRVARNDKILGSDIKVAYIFSPLFFFYKRRCYFIFILIDNTNTYSPHITSSSNNQNQLCDISILCDDGKEFPAHKIVLSSVSPYFHRYSCNFKALHEEIEY